MAGLGLPRMIPLQRIKMKAVIPTIIVTSPGRQVSLWARATIQDRMNGATQAAIRAQRRIGKVWNAVALLLLPMCAEVIAECGLPLVVNQGSQSEAKSTSAATIPISSPGVSLDRTR